MSAQKFASYVAAAMLVVGVVYLIRNTPDAKTSNKAKDVTATTKGRLNTTPIQTSAVTIVQEPLSALMAKARNFANLFLPSKVDQSRRNNPFGSVGGSDDVQRASYTAPLRPEYRVKALAGPPQNVVYLPGNVQRETNL